MVRTEYPTQLRYANKFTMCMYGMFIFGPLHYSFYTGHFSWKKGKLPRLTHNDMRYQKMILASASRDQFLLKPAIDWYPDVANRMHMKYINKFLKKHRQA